MLSSAHKYQVLHPSESTQVVAAATHTQNSNQISIKSLINQNSYPAACTSSTFAQPALVSRRPNFPHMATSMPPRPPSPPLRSQLQHSTPFLPQPPPTGRMATCVATTTTGWSAFVGSCRHRAPERRGPPGLTSLPASCFSRRAIHGDTAQAPVLPTARSGWRRRTMGEDGVRAVRLKRRWRRGLAFVV